MNERIRELAIQAGFFYEDYKDIWYLEYHNETCEEEMKKFAELIVRECIKEMGRYEFIDVAMREVKEHFGVEE